MGIRTIDDADLIIYAIAGVLAGWTAHQGAGELRYRGGRIGRDRVYQAWQIARELLVEWPPDTARVTDLPAAARYLAGRAVSRAGT